MTDAVPETPFIDAAHFRRVLGHFPTGVTVVTALGADGPIGVAIGSFASISLDPPLVGFFLGTESSSGPVIEAAGAFCVNVLGQEQVELCGRMASKMPDKFEGIDWTPAEGSHAPVLPGVHAIIDCRLDQIVPLGDHNLIVGRVLHLDTVEHDANPMVFHKGRYGTFGP
jgi:flavin reductase (DIM6/NTAB) family NADH-FMN oxidoreductase RutF